MSRVVVIDGNKFWFWVCGTCGIASACPNELVEEHRKVGGYRYCANGHTWGWSKEMSKDERIRRERDQLKQNNAMLEDARLEAVKRAITAETAAKKAEAATKRLKRRTAAGVCPCCHRMFSKVALHMQQKHPEYVINNKIIPIKAR